MAKVNIENAAFHLLTSPTYAEAARRANISESTLLRLRKKNEFQEVLNSLKKEMFSETMQKAQSYSIRKQLFRKCAACRAGRTQ